mmetsp:Transcript_30098/g.76674  ORF Transcript_30098/g.76674 Transcript_30098/m.76674 type:complete len:208 (-) Transcript_30098:639-1262(-)
MRSSGCSVRWAFFKQRWDFYRFSPSLYAARRAFTVLREKRRTFTLPPPYGATATRETADAERADARRRTGRVPARRSYTRLSYGHTPGGICAAIACTSAVEFSKVRIWPPSRRLIFWIHKLWIRSPSRFIFPIEPFGPSRPMYKTPSSLSNRGQSSSPQGPGSIEPWLQNPGCPSGVARKAFGYCSSLSPFLYDCHTTFFSSGQTNT